MSILPDGRYIDDQPYEPDVGAEARHAELDMSNARLVWRRFREHRLGLISAAFLLISYVLLPFAGFISPYTANERAPDHLYASPQGIHLFHQGKLIGPYVYPISAEVNLETFSWEYHADLDNPARLEFFCEASEYKLAGLVKTNRHLVCAPEGATIFLLGADRLGRDVFSRILYGAQLSLTVGLVGITVSFVIGIILGSIAGYFGHHPGDRDLAQPARTALVASALCSCAVTLEPGRGVLHHIHYPRHS